MRTRHTLHAITLLAALAPEERMSDEEVVERVGAFAAAVDEAEGWAGRGVHPWSVLLRGELAPQVIAHGARPIGRGALVQLLERARRQWMRARVAAGEMVGVLAARR